MKTDDKTNILIVDDIPANLLAMEELVNDTDLNIFTAESGREALSIMEKEDIALALLDVHMPEMDGYQVVEIMSKKEETEHIPVIFVTASFMDTEHEFKGYRSGAIDYLFKPLNPLILKSKIRLFVRLHNQKRRIEKQNIELQKQLEEIKQLRSILPICMSCNRIRDDNGVWRAPEEYFSEKLNVDYSHGICPECSKKLYPELDKD